MRAGVEQVLVEADAGDRAGLAHGEPHAQRDGYCVGVGGDARAVGIGVQRARAGPLGDGWRRRREGPLLARIEGRSVDGRRRDRHPVRRRGRQRPRRREADAAGGGVVGHVAGDGPGRPRHGDRRIGDVARRDRDDRGVDGDRPRTWGRCARHEPRRRRRGRVEHGVDVVVRGAVGERREPSGLSVDARAGRSHTGRDRERRRGVVAVWPVVIDVGVSALRRGVRDDVRGAGGHRDRLCEHRRLPAGCGLADEGRLRERRPLLAPQRADVGPRVRGALEEAHTRDVAVPIGVELDAELDGLPVVGGRSRRHFRAEDGCRPRHRHRPRRAAGRIVRAVVDRSRPDRRVTRPLLDVRIRPRRRPARRVPGGAAVGGHLDPRDPAATRVGCRSGEGDGRAVRDLLTLGRVRDRRGRRSGVGARRGRGEPAHQRRRLCPHVGEQVHLRLLHPRVCRSAIAVVHLVEAPGPLDARGREDECTAGGSIERDMMRRRAGDDRVAVVGQVLGDVPLGRRETDEARGTESVVDVFVRLVADSVRRELGRGSTSQ